MSHVLLSYDLHGNGKSKFEFLDYLEKRGWSDHYMRQGKLERLPNTTLLTTKTADPAEQDFHAARNHAANFDTTFKVTHWTLGPYTEHAGDYDPITSKSKVSELVKSIGLR